MIRMIFVRFRMVFLRIYKKYLCLCTVSAITIFVIEIVKKDTSFSSSLLASLIFSLIFFLSFTIVLIIGAIIAETEVRIGLRRQCKKLKKDN